MDQVNERGALPFEPFTIQVPDAVLADLETRLRQTRWPDPAPGRPWEHGTDLDYLRRLVEYWVDGFDWRAEERRLNGVRQFRAELGNLRIHFVHERAVGGSRVPLILTHGWPSSFAELLPLVPLLTDPQAHGIDGPAFDVVIPSLPGYGFSDRPARATYRSTARLWHELMQGLGYERYGVGGADFGAGVATFMALEEPERVLGVHLSTPELSPYIGPGSSPLSPAEAAYLEQRDAWDAVERGYSSIQSTRPQTVGYGLNDSPAGLAAWILEKWRAWADTDGDLEGRFSRDFLLTVVTLYWVTGTITSSMRDYFDNRWHGETIGPETFVHVPTAIASFPRQFAFEGEPPREWSERLYDVRRWTRMERGGHFAAAEEPQLLARDIAGFFGSI